MPNDSAPAGTAITARDVKKVFDRATGALHKFVLRLFRADVLDVEDVHFHFDSAVLLPDFGDCGAGNTDESDQNRVTGLAVIRAALRHAEANPSQKMLIAGHTDRDGQDDYNLKLSQLRADNVRHVLQGLIEGNRDKWVKICDEKHKVEDYQQILKWVDTIWQWGCDPGDVNNVLNAKTRAAIKVFQHEYNRGAPHMPEGFTGTLVEDGDVGSKTWGAFFDVYMTVLQLIVEVEEADLKAKQSAVQFLDDGRPTVGCGETHPLTENPAVDRRYTKEERAEIRRLAQKDRRVEILFFDPGEEPKLDCHPKPAKCVPAECEIYTKRLFLLDPLPCEPVPPPVSHVVIRAENGTDPGPHVVAVSNSVKLKGVPLPGGLTGTYAWTTASTLITLQDATSQIVTVVGGKTPSAAPEAEEITLTFTPTSRAAPPPVTHKLGVATVIFSEEASHPWGYDKHEKIKCEDKDDKKTEPTPGPAVDFVSIEREKIGKIHAEIKGAKPADVFFTSDKEAVCRPAVIQPAAVSQILELEAKATDKDETRIKARIGSDTGPVVAEIGAVVLKEVTYKAEFFRVKDSKSAKTALKLTPKAADLQAACSKYYKPGVAKFDINGGATELDVNYDLIKNGILDLEPGTTTDEQKKIEAACVSTRSRVIYVHKVHWRYLLASDASKTDTKIKLKKYRSAYLNYFGTSDYKLEDKNGDSVTVTIKKVDTSTGEVELTAAVGKDFKVGDKAGLIFPLGGLSGDPLYVGDVGSFDDLANYVAHELGHTLPDLDDLCEKNNVMFGGGETGEKLRRRPIPRYYDATKNEEQWTSMKGR